MTEYGYLKYVPSFKKNKASKIFFTLGYDERDEAHHSRNDPKTASFTLQKGEIAGKSGEEKQSNA